MSLSVRNARQDDASDLSRIAARTFPLACPPETPKADLDFYIGTELTPERFRTHIATPDRRLFVASLDDAVVGYLMLSRGEAPAQVDGSAALEVSRLYVLPEAHGRGVAQALMQQAFASAVSDGCRSLWLGVSMHNPRGIAFYRKSGFSVVGEKTFVVGNDIHHDYIMSCRLPELAA